MVASPEWWQLMLQYGAAPALVAVVSTAALVIQNWQNNDREDRRREADDAQREKDRQELVKDRDHRATEAKAERDQRAAEALAERLHQQEEASAERTHQAGLAEVARQARTDEMRARNDHDQQLARDKHRQELAERWRDDRRQAHVVVISLLQAAMSQVEAAASKLKWLEDGTADPAQPNIDAIPSPDQKARIGEAVAEVQIIGSQDSRRESLEAQERIFRADVVIWACTSFRVDTYDRAYVYAAIAEARASLSRYVDAVRSDLGTDD